MGWPLLGETLGFLKPHPSNSIGPFLHVHISRYGRIFKSHLFGSPTIVSCDLELNQFVLQNEGKVFECSYPEPMHAILGSRSLLIATGDLHRRLRSVASAFIAVSRSNPEFLHYVEKVSASAMESWGERRVVGFCKEAKMLTLTLMLKLVMSVEAEDPMAARILPDFLTYMRGFVSLPCRLPGTPFARAVRARERLSWRVRQIIADREKQVGVEGGRDFIDLITSKGFLSDDEKVSIVLDMLLGGYETTATVMALVVFFLGLAPPAVERLKVEHSAIRKSRGGEPLNWEDYKKMTFTQHVISEAMRCGNLAKIVHRKAIKDVKFKGYLIPSGWKVLPVFTATHLDPSLHENPEEFNPWRWEDQTISKKVMSFGSGPRVCPGGDLARVVLSLFLHRLTLTYRWKPKEDDLPLAYPYVEFKKGLPLEMESVEK